MEPALLELHGLVVRAELPIAGAAPAPAGAAPDLHMMIAGARPVPRRRTPEGQVMARIDRAGQEGVFATLVRQADGDCLLRCHGVTDVHIARNGDRVVFHPDPNAELGLLEVLGAGLVLAVVCILRGHLVLHASAVAQDQRCIALVGRSGAGKSTTAALLCRSGARLLTDDVLRVDVGDPPLGYRGSTENRLRTTAAAVLAGGGASRGTADGRLAVAVPAVQVSRLPLRCVVIPYPDRQRTVPHVERVTPKQGLLLLAASPRVPGWQDVTTRAEQFRMMSDLARTTPVLVATMPWGPPFPERWSHALLDAVADQVGT